MQYPYCQCLVSLLYASILNAKWRNILLSMVRSSCIFGKTVMKIGTDKDNYMQQAPCKFILGRNQALGYTLVFPGSCNTILPCKKLNTCLENSVLCYVLTQGLYLGTTKVLMKNYNPSICKEQAIVHPTESGWVCSWERRRLSLARDYPRAC